MARVGKYRNVAVPIENYDLLKDIADQQNRSIARQLAHMIEEEHFQRFPGEYEAVQLAKQFAQG